MKILARSLKIIWVFAVAPKSPDGLRDAFQSLGPTFIKLGQLMSARPDMVPTKYADALRHLLDSTTPDPFSQVLETIEVELGPKAIFTKEGETRPASDIYFEKIESTPISSASIGQVHKAKLSNGETAVIKILHTGIEESVELDLQVLNLLASFIAKLRIFGELDMKSILEEFSEWLRNEIDLSIELGRIIHFRENLKEFEDVVIPKPYEELSSTRVLTMEFLEGISVNKVLEKVETERTTNPAELNLPFPINFEKTIEMMVSCFLFKQVLQDGYFHGDLHAANMLFLPGNKVGLLDFGIVGLLDRKEHKQALMMILSVVQNDPDAALKVFVSVSHGSLSKKDMVNIENSISKELHHIHGGNLRKANFGTLLMNIVSLGRKYGLHLSPGIVLISKSLALLEGIGFILIPDVSMVDLVKPHMRKYLAKEFFRKFSEEEIYRKVMSALDIGDDLEHISSIIGEDGIRVNVIDENKK